MLDVTERHLTFAGDETASGFNLREQLTFVWRHGY
jgi:hypothetical protein